MLLEYFEQTLVFFAVLFQRFQFDAAGAESAARCVGQGFNIGHCHLAGINQFVPKYAQNAIFSGQYRDFFRARGLNHRTGGGINHGGNSARLCVKQLSFAHNNQSLAVVY